MQGCHRQVSTTPTTRKSCPSRFEWPCVGALDPLPELVQCGEAMRRLVACDDAGVDSTNRGTDDPIGLDPCFVQGLIYTNLVGPQGSTALKDEYHLSIRLSAKFIDRLNLGFGHVTHRNLHKAETACSVVRLIWPTLLI